MFAVVNPVAQLSQVAFFRPSSARYLPLGQMLQVVPFPPYPATHRLQELWPVPSVVEPTAQVLQVRLAAAIRTPVRLVPLTHAVQFAPAKPGLQSVCQHKRSNKGQSVRNGQACRLVAHAE